MIRLLEKTKEKLDKESEKNNIKTAALTSVIFSQK